MSVGWWLEEAPPDPAAPPLEGDAEADVAIVGGGYTGLWTALELRRREPTLRVALLEAEFCGEGPSGRNGGFLHGFWSQLGRLREAMGDEGALEVARASTGVYAAVSALGEDVWLRKGGYVKVSAAPAQAASVERALHTAEQLGVPAEAEAIDWGGFRGVRFRDGATVQPARLARALRRAAIAAGVAVHERSRATRIRDGLVETEEGRVRARDVVVATGHPPLRRRIAYFRSHIVLTEPVGATFREAVTDGRMFIHYFRTTEDGRVAMGSAASFAEAESGLRRLLPQYADATITHRWDGSIDVASDHLPFFGKRRGTRIHYGAGYSGSGVGASWLGGKVLASLVLGADDEWARLPLVTRRVPRLPPEPLRTLGGRVVRSAILTVERAEEEGRRSGAIARAVASLPRLIGLRIGTR